MDNRFYKTNDKNIYNDKLMIEIDIEKLFVTVF